MKPTVLHVGTDSMMPIEVSGIQAAIASSLPFSVSAEQMVIVNRNLAEINFTAIPTREIAMLGSEAEITLHRTLDGFLSKIDQFENPRLFKLAAELKNAVDKEQLPELADRILNGKPGMLDRLKGMFSKKALTKAMDETWEETKRLASGKTKTLVDLVSAMDHELRTEQHKLENEVRSMEQLKDAYRDRYDDFVVAVAFTSTFLEQAKAQVAAAEQSADQNDPVHKTESDELRDKLQALESRALALEGTLTRLPADQLVIRQLQNAGISTLQETTTTASARFASIKMTLLTLHGALVTKSVQRLAEQGATLDANLAAVRSLLMKDIVTKAANAPGDNRIAQAQQLKAIVAETTSLVSIVEQARASNAMKFAQARQVFDEARKEMLALGQQIRPDQQLKF
jgi:hypothetical protein